LFSVVRRRDAKRVRRERARLAEMHSSSPHRFAVNTFTHGSGGKKQTQRGTEANGTGFHRRLANGGKELVKSASRVRDRVPRKGGTPKAKATHLLLTGVMTGTTAGNGERFYLQKCRKCRGAEGGPDTISSTRSASFSPLFTEHHEGGSAPRAPRAAP